MLAVFGVLAQTNGSKAGSKEAAVLASVAKWKITANVDNARENTEKQLFQRLNALTQILPDELHCKVKIRTLGGDGCHGCAYVPTSRCAFKEQNDSHNISTLFSGNLTHANINEIHIDRHLHRESDVDVVESAYIKVSSIHNKFAGGVDFADTTLLGSEISKLRGPYAFVLYDRREKRIVAARDSGGIEMLFWASSEDGGVLYFSNDRMALYEAFAQVNEFPPGSVFISQPGKITGTLNGRPFNGTSKASPARRSSLPGHLLGAEVLMSMPSNRRGARASMDGRPSMRKSDGLPAVIEPMRSLSVAIASSVQDAPRKPGTPSLPPGASPFDRTLARRASMTLLG